ncbi:hypothetical protein MTP99_008731 [Tenebrio molitor]|nr:hypothetical protein MTP99_008731 [Tenebrio molitor]
MSVRVRSSLTNKRLRSGKSGAAPGTDHPVGGRTAETIIQSCQGLRRTGGGKGAEEKIQLGLMVMVNLEILDLDEKGENTRWRLRDIRNLWHVTTRVENNRMILSETED